MPTRISFNPTSEYRRALTAEAHATGTRNRVFFLFGLYMGNCEFYVCGQGRLTSVSGFGSVRVETVTLR